MIENEVWKSIPAFSRYEVSNHGNVRRVVSFPDNKRNCDLFKLKKFRPGGYKKMYQRVGLVSDAGRKQCDVYVHRLVLEVFLEKCPSDKHQASHLDGNPKNNHISNLLWELPAENSERKIAHGTSGKGSLNSSCKISESDAEFIILCYSLGMPPQYIYRMLNQVVSKATISNIALGRSWKHIKIDNWTRARCSFFAILNTNSERTKRIMHALK